MKSKSSQCFKPNNWYPKNIILIMGWFQFNISLHKIRFRINAVLYMLRNEQFSPLDSTRTIILKPLYASLYIYTIKLKFMCSKFNYCLWNNSRNKLQSWSPLFVFLQKILGILARILKLNTDRKCLSKWIYYRRVSYILWIFLAKNNWPIRQYCWSLS